MFTEGRSLDMCRILVTGGAGFIGSHTCVALINAGFSIVVMDNLSRSGEESLRRIKAITGTEPCFYKGDVCDKAAVERVFRENDISAVIHFAGLKAVSESLAMPLMYYHNNVYGTMQLIDAMENAGCRKLVFSSSATVYGDRNDPPYTEEMMLSAVNPYGQTKIMVEQILADLCASQPEWSVAALRYFNPAGAHKSGLLGESPFGVPSNLIPCIADTVTGKRNSLPVFGTDYNTADGTAVRDFIHVMDVAEGHIAALREYTDKRNGFRAFNLGTGKGSSVFEAVRAYEAVSGRMVPLELKPRRTGDTAISYADPSRAETELHWKARADLMEMCEDSWRFICRNPQGL